MSRFIPWSAYLRLIMSQGIVSSQCLDSYHEMLIETNNESGHRFHTMSWFIPWSAYLRLMSQGIVSSQCHDSPPHPVSFTSLNHSFPAHSTPHRLTPDAQPIHPPNHTPSHSPCTTYTPTHSLPMHNLYTHPITHPITPHAQPIHPLTPHAQTIHPPNHTPTHSRRPLYTH